jgi:hypothetical protein
VFARRMILAHFGKPSQAFGRDRVVYAGCGGTLSRSIIRALVLFHLLALDGIEHPDWCWDDSGPGLRLHFPG